MNGNDKGGRLVIHLVLTKLWFDGESDAPVLILVHVSGSKKNPETEGTDVYASARGEQLR